MTSHGDFIDPDSAKSEAWLAEQDEQADAFTEDVEPDPGEAFSIREEPPRTRSRARTARGGAGGGINWLAGVTAALVIYFAFQAIGTQQTNWGPWWFGGYEPAGLWVACLVTVPVVATLFAISSRGGGRRWK